MSSTDKQGSSLGSFPTFPPLYPHFNWPSGFWPCVKSCLVGGSDKYYGVLPGFLAGPSGIRAGMGARNQEQTRGRIGPQLRLGNLRVGELYFCPLCTALDQASSLSRKLAYVPGPTFGFVKLLASSGSHCTKWADEQHWQAGFESRLLPDLPLPFIPTLIGLRAFDLVSSRVWWRQRQILRRAPRLFSWAVWHSCRMGARNQEQTRGRIGPQLQLGNLRVGELHFCPLSTH